MNTLFDKVKCLVDNKVIDRNGAINNAQFAFLCTTLDGKAKKDLIESMVAVKEQRVSGIASTILGILSTIFGGGGNQQQCYCPPPPQPTILQTLLPVAIGFGIGYLIGR